MGIGNRPDAQAGGEVEDQRRSRGGERELVRDGWEQVLLGEDRMVAEGMERDEAAGTPPQGC